MYHVLVGSFSVNVGVSILYVSGLSTIIVAPSTLLYDILYSISADNGVTVISLSGIVNSTCDSDFVDTIPAHSNHTIFHHLNTYPLFASPVNIILDL